MKLREESAHRTQLVRIAATVSGDLDAAHELVQDAFAALLRVVDQVDDPAVWLRRVVVNRARSWVRHRIVVRRYLPELAEAATATTGDTADVVAVRDALAGLTADQRAVVVLRVYLDLPEAETADALGIPVGTVKSRLSRALKTLGACFGIPPTASRCPGECLARPQEPVTAELRRATRTPKGRPSCSRRTDVSWRSGRPTDGGTSC